MEHSGFELHQSEGYDFRPRTFYHQPSPFSFFQPCLNNQKSFNNSIFHTTHRHQRPQTLTTRNIRTLTTLTQRTYTPPRTQTSGRSHQPLHQHQHRRSSFHASTSSTSLPTISPSLSIFHPPPTPKFPQIIYHGREAGSSTIIIYHGRDAGNSTTTTPKKTAAPIIGRHSLRPKAGRQAGKAICSSILRYSCREREEK